jgi:hypothetical protein
MEITITIIVAAAEAVKVERGRMDYHRQSTAGNGSGPAAPVVSKEG